MHRKLNLYRKTKLLLTRTNFGSDFLEKLQPTDKILELVNWLDKNEKQVIKRQDIFMNWKGALLFIVAILFAIIEILNLVTLTNFDKIFTLLTLAVILLAFTSIVMQTTEKNVFDARFKNALKIKNFSGTERPLLKALIKIKSKNREFQLSKLYYLDKEAKGDLFTESRLLEIICK